MKKQEIQDQAILEGDSVYDIINDLVIRQLKRGIIPWQKKWKAIPFAQNLLTGEPYRGINRITTNISSSKIPYFLSSAQIKSLGSIIKEDSTPVPFVYWERPEDSKSYIPKSFLLWNVEQIQGINWELPKREYPGEPLDEAEGIVEGMLDRPRILREGLRSGYFPEDDLIQIPAVDSFDNPHNFYQLLFQLLTFATGAKHRLNRDTVTSAGKLDPYAFSLETLTAEISCQTLSNIACLTPNRSFTNATARIEKWIEKLQENKLYIFLAASQSRRVVDYILG